MKNSLRRKEIIKRKNFFPTLIVTIIVWLSLGFLVYFVEPDFLFAIPLFFVLVFFALLFTFSTILVNSRQGLIVSSALTTFLILRYFGVGNIINFLLLMGLAITLELFIQKKK